MYNAALIKMQQGLSALVSKIGELAERPMYIPIEYFDFNVLGAWVGEKTPGFLAKIETE